MNERPPLLELANISKTFRTGVRSVAAVQNFNMKIFPGECVALVGETGSGKSTIGRIAVGLIKPGHGDVLLGGKLIHSLSLKEKSRQIQMIFQDWSSSLDPKKRMMDILKEPWILHPETRPSSPSEELSRHLQSVRLSDDILSRYPRELSGGQLQRISIIRALLIQPRLLIADEPTASLDIPTRRDLIAILKDISKTQGISLLLITHDFESVKSLADKIVLLYKGMIVDQFSIQNKFPDKFLHPYSERLIHQKFNKDQDSPSYELLANTSWKAQCPFNPVCPKAIDDCARKAPDLVLCETGQEVRCHNPTVFIE